MRAGFVLLVAVLAMGSCTSSDRAPVAAGPAPSASLTTAAPSPRSAGSAPSAPPSSAATSVPAGVRVVTVGNQPCTSVPGGGAMWVSNFGDNTISRIDPLTDALDGLVYVPAVEQAVLLVIDPRTDKITRRLALGSGYSVAQAGFGAMWLCNFRGNTVARVDPAAPH
jgi:streptogramin lyase